MSFGNHKPPPEPDTAGIEEEQVSSSQESVPVPFVAGTRKIAVKWISRVYNQKSKPAPAERPGKK